MVGKSENVTKTYMVLNYEKEVIKTYTQLGSAKKLAKEIEGYVVTQLYNTVEYDKGTNGHHMQSIFNVMFDFSEE